MKGWIFYLGDFDFVHGCIWQGQGSLIISNYGIHKNSTLAYL